MQIQIITPDFLLVTVVHDDNDIRADVEVTITNLTHLPVVNGDGIPPYKAKVKIYMQPEEWLSVYILLTVDETILGKQISTMHYDVAEPVMTRLLEDLKSTGAPENNVDAIYSAFRLIP